MSERKCPECNGRMEKGQLVDQNYAVSGAQEWARHASSLLGIGRSEGITIISYRCVNCGFLKNYAPGFLPGKEIEELDEQLDESSPPPKKSVFTSVQMV